MLRVTKPCVTLFACFWVPLYLYAAKPSGTAALNASLGWSAYEAGHLQEAKSLMARAVKQSPKQADYQAALGIIELETDDQMDAVRHLRIAIELRPSNAEYRLRLASAYQVAGNDLDALKTLELVRIDPALQATWHLTRGFSLFRVGRLDAARGEFEPLLADPQFSAPASFFLGNIAFSESLFNDAADYYEVAVRGGDVETNVAYNAYTYDYGLTLFRLGRYLEAKEQFKSSVARYDKDPLPWMYIGRCEQELGNYPAAIDMMEKSIQMDPKFGLAYYELARLQKKYGDPARAAQLFDIIASMKQEEIAAEEKRAAKLMIGDARR